MITLSNAHNGHEQFVYRYDRDTGLRAIIAVHNTLRGPGLGGVRLWRYSTVEEAMVDALRLSEGMTYKNAVAGLDLGGGKSVILADGLESDPEIREARFRKFGEFIDDLNGRYIAAEDVGTKPGDMVAIRRKTQHVLGMPVEQGGSGDPSPMTAFGVLRGIQALVEDVLRRDTLDGVHVAVQGLGKVGFGLAELLLEVGAEVTGTDVNEHSIAMAREIGVRIVEPGDIYNVPCEVFAPCALGAVINDTTVHTLKCKIIAGSANNQLASPRHGEYLHDQGIVYGVDYVINAGGVINVASELEGYDEGKARRKTDNIYHTIKRLLEISRMERISTLKAADIMAKDALTMIPA